MVPVTSWLSDSSKTFSKVSALVHVLVLHKRHYIKYFLFAFMSSETAHGLEAHTPYSFNFNFFAFKLSETAYGLEAAVVPYDVVQCVRVYFCFGFRDLLGFRG
jgi:hypothetical protein